MEKNFLSLITRCKEEPYIEEFVNYYLSEGVDKIYIIDDDSSNKNIYNNILLKNNIEIIFDKNIMQNKSINKLYNKIRNIWTWIIYVDIDEYITTKKNLNNTIRHELETTFKNCDCIKVPWVMMSCNSIVENPKYLLQTNIYRWNHNNKHINNISNEHKFRCRHKSIEVKCIFKPKYFDDIFYHHPINPVNNNVKIVDGVYNKYKKIDPFYNKKGNYKMPITEEVIEKRIQKKHDAQVIRAFKKSQRIHMMTSRFNTETSLKKARTGAGAAGGNTAAC
jgi:hypothetical protein